MGADDRFLATHVGLMVGTGLIYLLNNKINDDLAMTISWYAIGPIGIAYSNMLVKFWKHSKDSTILPKALQLGKKFHSEKLWGLDGIATRYSSSLSSYSSIDDKCHEPAATKTSCIIALVCALTAQFIAAAHSQQAARIVAGIKLDGPSVIQPITLCHLVAVCIAWVCYAAAVCVFELECLDNFQKSHAKQLQGAVLLDV